MECGKARRSAARDAMLSSIILHNAKEQVSESSAAGADAAQQVHWGKSILKYLAFVST